MACLTSREEVVSEPASVIWLTPPRLELWEIGWKNGYDGEAAR